MKRIDRSSKGHYESETASRTATLGVHNLFEPYSNKLPLEQLAKRLVHESLWSDGCLFGRSQTRDSRGCPAAAHEQKRGCPRFRGQPLLCQALREGCMPRALP